MTDSTYVAAMTGADRGQGKLPLGVGSIIGDSFSILFRKFLTVMGLSAGPMVLSFLASGLLIGWDMTLQGEPTEFTDISGAFWTKYALVVVVQMAIYGITTALLVQLAYDAKLGSRRTFGQYLSPALSAAEAIDQMASDPGIDRDLLRVFVEALGLFPVGSVVELASGAWAVVVGPSDAADAKNRPQVRPVTDAAGLPLDGAAVIDLGLDPQAPGVVRLLGSAAARFNVARALVHDDALPPGVSPG